MNAQELMNTPGYFYAIAYTLSSIVITSPVATLYEFLVFFPFTKTFSSIIIF